MDIKDITGIHKELNPKLWYDNNLRREVELHLLQIAMAFIKFINIPDLQLVDVTISGSNASYNYNAKSDIDLHLVVDENSKCYEHLKELFLAKKSLFNEHHDITIRGINVEVYVQEKGQPHISNGIYSVYKDEWLKQPKRQIVEVDKTNTMHKYQSMKHEVEQAIKSNNLDKIDHVKQRIKDMRAAGLAANGEFGAENLAFKLLRNSGLMDELYSAATQAQDKLLSIESATKNKFD
jgi:hypothetical protein